jgi:hypothetical protein
MEAIFIVLVIGFLFVLFMSAVAHNASAKQSAEQSIKQVKALQSIQVEVAAQREQQERVTYSRTSRQTAEAEERSDERKSWEIYEMTKLVESYGFQALSDSCYGGERNHRYRKTYFLVNGDTIQFADNDHTDGCPITTLFTFGDAKPRILPNLCDNVMMGQEYIKHSGSGIKELQTRLSATYGAV